MKNVLMVTLAFLAMNHIHAQVKIGANPATVNTNSVLEIESTGKGILLPRSTTAQVGSMSNVPKGMLLYNTTDSVLYLKRDTGWVMIPVSKRSVNPTLPSPVYADFFALMPGDNPVPVFPGSAVQFPQTAVATPGITRASASAFYLDAPGTYQVSFTLTVNEPGQLIINLDGGDIPYSVAGRAIGSSQISGTCLITTNIPYGLLEIRNPAGNSTALTLPSNTGGTRPVSAHLVIHRLN